MTDFENLTPAERTLLHQVIKRFLRTDKRLIRGNRHWQTLFEAAYNGRVVGQDDFKNLGKGTLSKEKACLVYEWLLEHRPKVIGDFNAELMKLADEKDDQERRASRLHSLTNNRSNGLPPITWDGLVLDKGIFGSVDIRLVQPQDMEPEQLEEVFPLPLRMPDLLRPAESAVPSKLVDHDPLSKTVVPLKEEFYFEINSPEPCHVIGFQRITPQWEPLILNTNNTFMSLSQGSNLAPVDDQGSLAPLIEREQARRHKFVFVVSADELLFRFGRQVSGKWQIDDMLMDEFAVALNELQSTWQILRIDVMFKE
ncbi:hypothetical protein [Cohaesibacter celericrescens]|uniref:Uncharacterized protein n=1 Tax=Cohaesibacter celericrescens TaxID=2067669 RepID=A0A2N5XPK8_9HYPH|nr:hypothetical protein [Cohaesibacter celericrescens]PLW76424.1 hypothetical protein C0081_16240 [Cohaesibacter celericrescens]